MFPDIIVWPDALYLIAAQANKYIFYHAAHILAFPCKFSNGLFTFNFQKSSFCLFVQTVFLLCPAYISFSFARLYFLPRQIEGRCEDIFPCQGREDIPRLITLHPTNASPHALLLQLFPFSFRKGIFGRGDICFSSKEIKSWVQLFHI